MRSKIYQTSMKRRDTREFQLNPRKKDSSTGVAGNLRENILLRVRNTICKKPSIFGYGSDILSSLNEINIQPSKYLELCIHCLTKQTRNLNDIQLINGFLFFMKEFVTLIKKQDESHLNDYLQLIAMYMGYEKLECNRILCKFGDKGKKAYIVLQGKIDILIKQVQKIRITEIDYFGYIASLLKYQEYGLLSLVLKENFEEFPIEIIENKKNEEKEDKENKVTKDIEQSANHNINNINEFVWKPQKVANKDKLIQFTARQLVQMIDPHFYELPKHKEKELINNVSSEDYISRINTYTEITEENEFHPKYRGQRILNVVLYRYVKILTKAEGSLIGEIALSDPLALRSASMISSSECHLGTINKHSYSLSLKSCAERQRRQNVTFIQSFHIFSDIPLFILGKRYFNNFIVSKKEKGGLLMEEKKISEFIFLLKDGEYEVSLNASLKDLHELKYIISEKLCQNQVQRNAQIVKKQKELMYFDNLIRDNPQFSKEFYTKRRVVIGDVTSPDIIGLSDYTDRDGCSLFTVECKSAKSEMFQLSLHFYIEMKRNDKTVKDNEIVILKQRFEKMINRVNLIMKSKVESFYDYKSKRKKFHLEHELRNEFGKRCQTAKKVEIKNSFFNKKISLLHLKRNSSKENILKIEDNTGSFTYNNIRNTSPSLKTFTNGINSNRIYQDRNFSYRDNQALKRKLKLGNSPAKNEGAQTIQTRVCQKIINLKRSRNNNNQQNQNSDTIFTNVFLKTFSHGIPKSEQKSVTSLDHFKYTKENYESKGEVCVISPLHSDYKSSSLIKKRNISISISNLLASSAESKKLNKHDNKLVEIESYSNYKKAKYLNERNLYIKNQIKKFEIKMKNYFKMRKNSN